jgi:hypothetical protein
MSVSTFLIGTTDPELYSMSDGIKRADNNIQLTEVIHWAEYDPIWANRGKAVQAYAQLESALNHLLQVTSGMSWEASAAVFYKITNTNARNSILEKLLHQKCGANHIAEVPSVASVGNGLSRALVSESLMVRQPDTSPDSCTVRRIMLIAVCQKSGRNKTRQKVADRMADALFPARSGRYRMLTT